jgi:hypothetical protein
MSRFYQRYLNSLQGGDKSESSGLLSDESSRSNNASIDPTAMVSKTIASSSNIDDTKKNTRRVQIVNQSQRKVTADTTLLPTDGTIFADCTGGNIVVTLPLSNTTGLLPNVNYIVIKTDNTPNTLGVVTTNPDILSNSTTGSTVSYTTSTFNESIYLTTTTLAIANANWHRL